MIKVNEVTGQREFITQAVIKSISPTVRKLNNEKETPWQLATAEITYPSGETQAVNAMLLTALKDDNPNVFVVGETVDIVIQLDGEHAGKGKLQLPIENPSIENLLRGIQEENICVQEESIEWFEDEESIESDNYYITNQYNDSINQNKTIKNEHSGCVSILSIIVCLVITAFIFSGTVKYIGFLAYPLIVISGIALAKFTEPLWFDNKK